MDTIKIVSTNYSGQSAVITYYPDTGGTINLGTQVLPYDYVASYFYGTYSLFFPAFGSTCTLFIEDTSCNFLLQENGDYIFQENYFKICIESAVSPTPTPSITPSLTSTPSVTPSITPSRTPSVTPSITPSETPTPSITPSFTPSETPTNTPTNTETPMNTPTNTETPTNTPTNTKTPTETPTQSPTNMETPTSTDPDADAFIAAANITDPTPQSAIQTLVVALKSNNIWIKLQAFYPFVGGTANSNKWNLKNPTDSNAAFRLAFNGGVTFTSSGIVGNGAASTFNNFLIFNSAGLSFGLYASTIHTLGQNRIPFGGGSNYIQWLNIGSPLITRFAIGGNTADSTEQSGTNTIGYFAVSQNRNSTTRLYYNKTSTLKSITVTSRSSIQTSTNTLLTYQGGGAATNCTISTAYISQFLDSTDMTNLRTIILNYNTTLGR